MVSMGFWQLSRAEYKDNLLNKIEQRKDLHPVSITELPHDEEDRLFLPVELRGTFDDRHQFLHDNRILNKKVGYHVFTPLRLLNGDSILVNRGWIPQGKTRQNLPELPVSQTTVEFTGILDRPPSKGFVLSEEVYESATWPMVLQYIVPKDIEQVLGYSLMPMVVWLDRNSEDIFQYELPVLLLDSAKNKGYAFQWFAMALTLLIIYIVLNTKKTGSNYDRK